MSDEDDWDFAGADDASCWVRGPFRLRRRPYLLATLKPSTVFEPCRLA